MVFIDLKVPSICTSVFVQEEFKEEDTELLYELTVLYFYTPVMSALMLHDKF